MYSSMTGGFISLKISGKLSYVARIILASFMRLIRAALVKPSASSPWEMHITWEVDMSFSLLLSPF